MIYFEKDLPDFISHHFFEVGLTNFTWPAQVSKLFVRRVRPDSFHWAGCVARSN